MAILWRETTLGEVCDTVRGAIQTGPFGSQLHQTDYSLEGIPVVMPKDIVNGRIDITSVARISSEHVERLSRHKFRSGDIVYGRRGDIGRQALIRKEQEGWLCGTGCLRLSLGNSLVNPLFLHYYLQQERVIAWITNQAVGATMPNLNTGILRSVPVRFPEMSDQLQIAGVLSAYDELIDNSQRRVRILETMARSLYMEWFVNYRFPGHEKVRRVPSALGEIPEKWKVVGVPECVAIDPRVIVPRDGEKPFVPMGSLSNDSMLITDVESREGNSGAKFQNGDTLFARITPCLENGKTGFVQFLADSEAVSFGSTEFIVLRSRTLTPEFVYLLARSDEFRENAIKSMSGASGRQRVQERCFELLRIAHPTRALLDSFSKLVQPIFQLIQQLHLQMGNLRRTRDLLVPRLLSGQNGRLDKGVQTSLTDPKVEEAGELFVNATFPVGLTMQANVAGPHRTGNHGSQDIRAPSIDDTDRTEVLCAIRSLFNDDQERERDVTIRELALALGYQRTGSRVYEVLSIDLQTAVRRGIIVNVGGVYRRGFRTLADCTRDSLKKDFESAIGRVWVSRDDGIRALARWLGFARVGPVINETGRSLINGLIREGRLETDGPERIRRT